MTRFLVTVAIALTLALPAHASNFHFGKVRFEPKDTLAFVVDGTEPMTIVALTDFKIDRAEVMAAIDPGSSLFQQAAAFEANVVFVRLTKEPGKCGLAGYLGKTAQQIDLGNSFASKTTTSTNARVAGNCATTAPGKMFDDAYDFNLSYDLPITSIPKPAKLAAGGGEPGTAYAALVKAIQAANWDVASLHLQQQEMGLGKPKPADMKGYFHDIGLNYPKQATISGGLVKGDRALLDFTGKDQDGKGIRGVVAMKKVAGQWHVVDQSMFFTE